MKTFKIIASWAVAIIIALVFMSLILSMLRLAFSVIFNLSLIIVVLLMALPIFVIIRKKLFK
jgi:hypothetical protein